MARRLNGQFVSNKDEEIQRLRDELMRMNRMVVYYKGKTDRLMRELRRTKHE